MGSKLFDQTFRFAVQLSTAAQESGAAVARRETGELGTAFYDAKLASARYYMTRVLPAVEMHKARAMAGDLVMSGE